MKLNYILSLLAGFSVLLLALACSPEKVQKEEKDRLIVQTIGDEAFDKLSSAHRIAVMKVKPEPSGNFQVQGQALLLNSKQMQKLLMLLTDDNSYLFDVTKRCLFIPEYALQIQGEESLLLLLSPSCKQIRFLNVHENKHLTLDIDPSFESVMSVVKDSQN